DNLQCNHNIVCVGEIKMVELKATTCNINIQINTFYHPPKLSSIRFIEDFNQYFDSCKNKSNVDVVLFIGDIKIDILKDSRDSGEYLNILSACEFTSMMNCNTRVTKGYRSCIDHIFLKTGLSNGIFLP
ncbi:hypothetical protein WA026_007623, partial [Henosepilachna vigintioctopunctata]